MSSSAAIKRLTFYSDAEYFGGAEGYLLLLARHLDRSAFELSCVLPDRPGAKLLEGGMRELGVEVRHLERPGFNWLRRLPEMVRCFRSLGGEILQLNLPSSYDAGVSSVAWAARQAGYRRVVSTEHLPMIDRKYRKFGTKVFFTHWVDEIIVNTRSNREFLVHRHGCDPGKIRVIDNGVEQAPALSAAERARLREGWGAAPDTVVIGIVGRLTRRKGHHFLLEAASTLAAEEGLPPWMVVVAGDGEEEETLKEQARRLRLDDRVRWLGHREDAPRLMGAFDLLVLPSTVETMPFAILEGMAASLPVVASAIFGIPELVVPEETGFLIGAGDVPALTRRVRGLLLDSQARERMGACGRRRFLERFTVRRMVGLTARTFAGLEDGIPYPLSAEEAKEAGTEPARSAGACG